jgi:hypothetical protein
LTGVGDLSEESEEEDSSLFIIFVGYFGKDTGYYFGTDVY